MNKFFTIVTDCYGEDIRYGIVGQRWLGITPTITTIPGRLHIDDTLVAACRLIEGLGVARHSECGGFIIVNAAPRNGDHENGSPFCYFRVGKTVVVATIDWYTLSLAKKMNLLQRVHVMDVPTVMDWAAALSLISHAEADEIGHSNFRSCVFATPVGKWLLDGLSVPSKPLAIADIRDAPLAVCRIDNFGNVKTTLVNTDEIALTRFRNLPVIDGFRSAPVGQKCWMRGSSRYGASQLLELTIPDARMADVENLTVGSSLG